MARKPKPDNVPHLRREREDGKRIRLSPEEKVDVVATYYTKAKQNKAYTAALCDVQRKTVYNLLANPEVVEQAAPRIQELAVKMTKIADRWLEHYDAQMADADLNNKGSSFLGIILDKIPVYAGVPTVTMNVNVDANALASKAAELLAQYVAAIGDEQQAKALLAQDAPAFAPYLN